MADNKIKTKIREIIFRHDFTQARIFDVVLVFLILIASLITIIETVPYIKAQYWHILSIIEWVIIGLFTIEYFLRIYSSESRKEYIFSFYGGIDFISIFPMYLSLMFPLFYYLTILRTLRVLRIFRILKLLTFIEQESVLINSLKKSAPKVLVFIFFILIFSTVAGTFMYAIEGPQNGFSSIPNSVYWTIVTITTVGYGDIAPITPLGKFLSIIIMLCGYGVIAVPTGIVASDYAQLSNEQTKKKPIKKKTDEH